MPPAFSRLQLAAALIEYDNDPSNPYAPFRSAHDSAIFAPLRRLKPVNPTPTARNSYLSVALPSDSASLGPRQSAAIESRRSRASVSALRNMFGHEHDDDDVSDAVDDAEEGLDMDLASWGIDNLLAKDTAPKEKQKPLELPNPYPDDRPVSVMTRNVTAQRRPANTRTRSLGNFDQFLNETTLERDNTRLSERHRRASIGSPLDLAGMEQPTQPFTRLSDQDHEQPPEDERTVPFPSYGDDPTGRSVSQLAHYRTQSTASMGSRVLNDPKSRPYSTASMATAMPDDNPFALRPPSVVSRFDPKSHGRTLSTASMGTRMMPDADDVKSTMSRPAYNRASTTMDLLRPKVLVMPSPLQPPSQKSQVDVRTTEGFEVSIGGTPLPPGARSARKTSYFGVGGPAPDAANLFTPNPRLNMTLSQLTFRNNLIVGGQRDVTYTDIDGDLARATEEGQQIEMPFEPEESDPEEEEEEEGQKKPYRPAGKLYGKSLIDDLEMRKLNMRNKQRVFTGDQRPSMMERRALQRSSTLIDPASLNVHPQMKRMSSFGIQSTLDPRRQSTLKPLLNFDSQEHLPAGKGGNSMPASRSVFGVDVLWERETAKLKEIEALEKQQAEELRRQEEEKGSKKKKKGKGKDNNGVVNSPNLVQPPEKNFESTQARVSVAPPVLPAIQKASTRPPRGPEPRDEPESDESADEAKQPSRRKPSTETKRWFAGDSDEESPPEKAAAVKTTGSGPRYQHTPGNRQDASDSEEDVPLAATVNRAIQRQRSTAFPRQDDDSDEDKPLNALLEDKSKLGAFSINFDRPSPQQPSKDDDDDDAPLGLRASRLVPAQTRNDEDDDDKPLAFHPEQQRRTQFMAAQQQQQMMMQMQMQNSMFFPPAPPSMMGFPPPMMMPQMAPVPVPSPPPVQDPAKFGRVDRWRHDVAVEGEQ